MMCLPENIVLKPFTTSVIDLKIKVEPPLNYGLMMVARSSLASIGLCTLGGLIDEDYRGSSNAILVNVYNSRPITMQKGERVLQLFPVKRHDILGETVPAMVRLKSLMTFMKFGYESPIPIYCQIK